MRGQGVQGCAGVCGGGVLGGSAVYICTIDYRYSARAAPVLENPTFLSLLTETSSEAQLLRSISHITCGNRSPLFRAGPSQQEHYHDHDRGPHLQR